MPVSKRDKKVSLTKTTKKGMQLKQKLVENIRKQLEIHENLIVFTTRNMRNGPLKDARDTWEGSRFFMGKPKVMAIALGRTEAEEQHKNLHKVVPFVRGQCGLLLTSKPRDQVLRWFNNYSTKSFAKSGFVPRETIKLEAGPLDEFAPAIEPHLRNLGLPTKLEKGKIILRESHIVCMANVPLTPEQSGLLKLLKSEIAEFKLTPLCLWSKDGSFETFKVPKDTSIEGSKIIKQSNNNETNENNSYEEENKRKLDELSVDTLEMADEGSKENIDQPQEEIIDEDMDSHENVPKSPVISRTNPRRSMRTPKPIKKRTPEQKKQSVKRLTEPSKGTPTRKSIRTVKTK